MKDAKPEVSPGLVEAADKADREFAKIQEALARRRLPYALHPLCYHIKDVTVMQVIRIRYCQGIGVKGDVMRTVFEYRDMDGELIARDDPCAKVVYEEPE